MKRVCFLAILISPEKLKLSQTKTFAPAGLGFRLGAIHQGAFREDSACGEMNTERLLLLCEVLGNNR